MGAAAANMDDAKDEVAALRTFRTTFRTAGGAAANASDFIIDQFRVGKPHILANNAGAAYNQG